MENSKGNSALFIVINEKRSRYDATFCKTAFLAVL